MHTVASDMEEIDCGRSLLREIRIPGTAATVVTIIAHIGCGFVSSLAKLRPRLPEPWVASMSPPGCSLEFALQELRNKAVDPTNN
eukprot:9196456-Pyramimonas_sp.AAC.1